ncbi:DNA-formamidopyrimidine glycosylase [[Mycoplasma] falconis]|uniref:DNA-formamidopyrimidine glycosylase n=1 Tax=[Mycoplasma] falconis TaxID=92403 RepID=A0A501XC43_9BACT|nr:DNA-formamidopyrimidine glycosylase [[Mycoplasma] falconis]TPE58056.1 DNA-formamidopyrimidine glycosylase [[Mycoplasma] falconis]
MPELPEVRTVCEALKPKILNKKIKSIDIFYPKLFKEYQPEVFVEALVGQKIVDIKNKGKHIIFFLDNNDVLLSHLRMEGKYRYYQDKDPNEKHLIMKMIFEDNSILHYLDTRMFGTFHLRNINNYNQILPLSKVADEPAYIDVNEVYQKLRKSTTAIKTKLLDQTIVSGIGNIYVDETLFICKVHPETPANMISLEKLAEIIKTSAEVMEKSFQLGGTTLFSYESLNQKQGSYQNFLQIHSNDIKICKRCESETSKIKVNGRGTYLCSNCQRKENEF